MKYSTSRKNALRSPQERKLRKNKIEQILSVGILVLLISSLGIYWYMDNDYENFIKNNNINQLIEQRAYIIAQKILDTAVTNPQNSAIKDDLTAKLKEVKDRIKVENPSQTFDEFSDRVEKIVQSLLLDSAVHSIEIALKDSNYSEIEENKLKNMIIRYNDDKNKLERGEKIRIPNQYVVKTGETLNGIAYRHDMRPSELLEINSLATDKVVEGQKLKVYMKVTFTEHEVKGGENLSHIANKYKTNLERLRKLNKLKSDRVQAGQKLKVGFLIGEGSD